MTLFILRHGLAGEPGASRYKNDADRPLTEEGKSKMRDIAKAMEDLELEFDLIVSSPFKRAHQTAAIVAEKLDLTKKFELSETLIPSGDTKELIVYLNHYKPGPKSVLLVGHEPYLSGLISLLITGERDGSVVLKKGGLAKLCLEAPLKHGRCAALKWLLTPKVMVKIGS